MPQGRHGAVDMARKVRESGKSVWCWTGYLYENLRERELLQELVALGCGVSILSALSVQEQVAAGKLLTFELEEKPVSRNIYMVYRKKSDLSDLARGFAQQVRQSKQETTSE